MKKGIDEAFIVFGMIFLVLIILSMFISINPLLDLSNKIYLLIFFVGMVAVNYYRFRKKRSK